MTTITQTPSASPVTARRVMTGPNCYVSLPPSPVRKTKLGVLAQQLADQTQITTLSVAFTSGLVNAITEASCPMINFTDMPPGMKSSLATLQSDYGNFQQNFSIFQGHASAWVSTPSSGSGPSILTQLVSVPQNLQLVNYSAPLYFTTLKHTPSSSPAYQTAMKDLVNDLDKVKKSIKGLLTCMETLGKDLDTGASDLIHSASTGTLAKLQAAYQADIASIQKAINSAYSTISSDNTKIIWMGLAASAFLAVGVVGVMNFWNPVGWVMMGVGAVGAYEAISEIETLKGEIAKLKTEIRHDESYKKTDKMAAGLLAGFVLQLQAFQSMNRGAQNELTELENLFNTLEQDITAALNEVNSDEFTDAQAEWTDAMNSASFLSKLTVYIWPSPTLLPSPSSYAAIGNDIYAITTSGEMFHLPSGASSWTDMQVTALSCVGAGSTLVAIDGAPAQGTSAFSSGNSTYFVKSYNFSSSTWTMISTFPAAAIAVNGTTIYAINQTVTDRQVYQYSGSGTTWTALPALPNSDCPSQLAVANGTLYALGNNTALVYVYSGGAWTPLNSNPYMSICGNGSYLALIDTSHIQYYYVEGSTPSPLESGYTTLKVAQLPGPMQFSINQIQQLWMSNLATNPVSYYCPAANVTTIFVSDTGVAYYADNKGNLYSITTSAVITQLPALQG